MPKSWAKLGYAAVGVAPRGKLRSNLPVATAGALGVGFIAAGGIGATMRLIMRRGREGTQKAKVGRFSLLSR